MKQITELQTGWRLKQLTPVDALDLAVAGSGKDFLPIDKMPAQVHDILLSHRRLPKEILLGWAEEAEWCGEYDWLYRCDFPGEGGKASARLKFHGVDTVADFYLNGAYIGRHEDFYLSVDWDVTGKIQERNTLLVHFHNITDYLNGLPFPEKWHETVTRCKLVRKPIHDFPSGVAEGADYQGACRYYSPIGLFGRAELVTADEAEITNDWIRTDLESSLDKGNLWVRVWGHTYTGDVTVKLRLLAPDGAEALVRERKVLERAGEWNAEFSGALKNPEPWWPRGFGKQPLYTVEIQVWNSKGVLCDGLAKKVGFRHIRMPYPLSFIVNGKKVRMYGGSMDPLQGYTHCPVQERITRLLDMVENANMNTLRIWGEGIPQPDEFYDECDRRGIIVWQEFFHGFSAYPDTEEYRALYRQEAKELILRLRHRVSLFMWCGGNETVMGSEFINREKPVYCIETLTKDYPALCGALDPGRYYHTSSPSGGEWANDPRSGDYHTYDCVWYYPFKEYPHFISEHIRTAPPAMHSLKKIIRGELWPQNYDSRFFHGDKFPMPDTWMERSNHNALGHVKTGPYWEYYDADNAYDMLYRFAAAYAQEMRDGLERVRMGGPDGNTPPSRRCKGHFSCKLNDTWPKVYCAVIDYFQEGFHPYYATLRAQQPVLVCFDVRDEIRLWLVNDSGEDVKGEVTFGLFDMEKNAFVYEKRVRAAMAQGDSNILFDLNYLQFFRRDLLLYARFADDAGRHACTSVDYVDIERHYKFPPAKLDATADGAWLRVKTDRFARCVEITGEKDGDEFGWLFSDNYFDLVPGEEKRVRIMGKTEGQITLKAHYSPYKTVVDYRMVGGEEDGR